MRFPWRWGSPRVAVEEGVGGRRVAVGDIAVAGGLLQESTGCRYWLVGIGPWGAGGWAPVGLGYMGMAETPDGAGAGAAAEVKPLS